MTTPPKPAGASRPRRCRGTADSSTRSWRRPWSATSDGRRRVISSSTPGAAATPDAPGTTGSTPTPTWSADASGQRRHELLVLERDDFDGDRPQSSSASTGSTSTAPTDPACWRRRSGRRPAQARQPFHHRRRATAGEPGTRSASRLQSVETLVPLSNGNLLIANDNNYPGNAARRPGHAGRHRVDHRRSRRDRDRAEAEVTVDRPPRRQRLPSRAHAGLVRAGHPSVRGLHRARRRADQGRRARRPARERDRRHHRRGDPPRVRRPSRRRRSSTEQRSPAGSPRTSRSRSCALCAPRSGSRTCARRTRPSTGMYPIPTLDEVLDLARHSRTCDGRPVGVYPETKHPTYFDSIGLSLEEPLLATR